MIRRPPRSTLFPTRRSSDLLTSEALGVHHLGEHYSPKPIRFIGGTSRVPSPPALRSEEHTSELQSRENLVCRLLLEKKNNNAVKVRANLMSFGIIPHILTPL